MKVRYRVGRDKEFSFQENDEVKVIEVSFLYADDNRPEKVFAGKITEIEGERGFWFLQDNQEPGEFIPFCEVEDVIGINDEYPNRKDPLIRFALDGPQD